MDSPDRYNLSLIGVAAVLITLLFLLAYTSDLSQRACSKEIAALNSYNPDEIRRICQ